MSWPSITIITCSYNPDLKIWKKSLDALKGQDYPKNKIEHLVMDGASKNETIELGNKYNLKFVIRKDLRNPKYSLVRMSLGLKKAKGDIILFLETDNIIIGKNWLKQMVKPFIENSSIIGTFSAYNAYESSMPLLTKYYSLFGVNDTFLYYLNKSEKLPIFKSKYDKGRLISTNKNYTCIEFDEKTLPTLGDNGHMVRRNIISKVNKNPKNFMHTDAFFDLLKLGYSKYAVVNNSIIHYTGSSIISSLRKRIFYRNNYLKRKRTYHVFDPKSPSDLMRVILFGFYSLTFIEPLLESLRGYAKVREKAWFLHPLMCLGTFVSYSISVVQNHTKS